MRNHKADAIVLGTNRVISRGAVAHYQATHCTQGPGDEVTINGRVYPGGMVRSGLAHAMEARRVVSSRNGQSNPA